MTTFNNTLAIVTGAASGIGLALSEALAHKGVEVVMADINRAEVEAAALRLRASGVRVQWVQCNVAEPGAAEQLVETIIAQTGRIDWLFNNAGVGPSGDVREFSPADWRAITAVNLDAVVTTSMAAYAHMVRRGTGHIINTASLGGLIPTPAMALYTATKHAVVGFSLALRAEARAHGVRVSVACPAFVRTHLRTTTRNLLGSHTVHPYRDAWISRMEPLPCARAILRGVEQNRALILIPWQAAVIWRLYQLWPELFEHIIFPWVLAQPPRSDGG